MIKRNYHTHTLFCDGKNTPREMLLAALEKGFKTLGFSAHSPMPQENRYSLPIPKIEEYFTTLSQLKEEFSEHIEILSSLEIDYLPPMSREFSHWTKNYPMDYTIGGIHLVKIPHRDDQAWFIDGSNVEHYDKGLQYAFMGDIRWAVASYYSQLVEMLQTQKPNIVAHFDKIDMNNKGRYFKTEEVWYQDLIEKTIEVIAECGTIVEVNTRGKYKGRTAELFPNISVIKKMKERNIPIVISTDAHQSGEIDLLYEKTWKQLQGIGYNTENQINGIYVYQ